MRCCSGGGGGGGGQPEPPASDSVTGGHGDSEPQAASEPARASECALWVNGHGHGLTMDRTCRTTKRGKNGIANLNLLLNSDIYNKFCTAIMERGVSREEVESDREERTGGKSVAAAVTRQK